MVVLSMESFENLQFESEVYLKLQEAKREAELTDKRYSSKDVSRYWQIAGVMKGRMAKTIKEIADNCGVSEQTVRGWCRRNHVAKGSFALSESPKSSI